MPLAKVAARVMVGATLAELRDEGLLRPPARRRPRRGEGGGAARSTASPRSTPSSGRRCARRARSWASTARSASRSRRARPGAGQPPARRRARCSSRSPTATRRRGLAAARRFAELGFSLVATAGTAAALRGRGPPRRRGGGQGGGGRRRHRRRRPHLVGQGRPGRQHAAGPGAAGRRRPHPAGGHGARRALRHHRRRRPGGRGRASPSGRAVRTEVRSLQEYHARRPAPARGLRGWRPAVDVAAAPPVRRSTRRSSSDRSSSRTRSSPRRARSATATSSPPLRPGPARRGHREVAGAASRGRATRAPRCTVLGGGMLNSVGLQGPGVEHWIDHDLPALRARGARVIASIWGRTVDDFATAAAMLRRATRRPRRGRGERELPERRGPVDDVRARPGATADAVRAAVDAELGLPVFAKLSPNVTDLVRSRGAALDAGATGLTLVNTVLGLVIDADTRRPVLGARRRRTLGPARSSRSRCARCTRSRARSRTSRSSAPAA